MIRLLASLALASLFLASGLSASAEEPAIVFIVNPANPVTELSIHQIADFYFKRAQRWPNGSKVRFIDQKDTSVQKRIFADRVLHKTPRELDLFWVGEKNFSGQGAPLQAPNDDLVLSMVAALPTAIGYVSASQATFTHVKRVTIKTEE